jgi:hypothetical protein
MATAAITSSIFQQIQSYQRQGRADLQELAKALKNGDLAAAKQAFSDLTALAKNPPQGNANAAQANPTVVQAFAAIGQALQTGDLAGARSAFSALQSTLAGKNSGPATASPAVIVNIGQNDGAGAVSNTESIFQQLQDFRNTRKSDVAQLGAALQSGDTQGAQQAYGALVALGKSGPNSNGAVFQRADRAQAFAAIGQALQSGDSAGAQKAFADLEATFQKPVAPPVTPPKEPPVPASASNPEIVINLGGASKGGNNGEVVINIGSGAGSGSNSPEEVQINLGGSNGGKLTIDVSQTQNGGEHVAIDFLQQNNDYRIALDLLNPSAHAAGQSSLVNVQA